MECPNCKTEMLLKSNDRGQFWGCPKWKERGCKTMPYRGDKPAKGTNDITDSKEVEGLRAIWQKLGELLEVLNAIEINTRKNG